MGISLFLKQIPAASIKDFLKDASPLHAYLKLPYKDYREYWEDENRDRSTTHDMDKSWHPIHFLLTGEPEHKTKRRSQRPATLLFGGTKIKSDLLGYYGPPRILSPAQISNFLAFLQTLDEEKLKMGFDPAVMAQEAVDDERFLQDREGAWKYYWDHFVGLREFLGMVEGKGDGVVLYLG
ncbi:hypothetical protein HDV00_001909 [Rhizophlyctis rosea]|nr:hypothetical protein HDV00_001909 [Rhizophlyctis rosea]